MNGTLFHRSLPSLMGTALEFIAIGEDEKLLSELWERLSLEGRRMERLLSRFDPESEVSRLANGVLKEPSHEVGALISQAYEYQRKTFGLFDITLGGRGLDFGGFAKGWFLERFAEELDSAAIADAFVDFGGSGILARGHHPYGDCWKVGVVNPWGIETVAEIELRNEAMSTSGNTPLYSGHILNPLTGETVEGRRLVTVVSRSPLDAEVLSTALMTADREQAERLQDAFPGTKCRIYDL